MPVKLNVLQPDAKTVKTFTSAQRISELTRCLRWFSGLFVLNIVTFWLAMLFVDRYPSAEKVLMAGLAMVGPLAIYSLYRFCRTIGSYDALIWYSLFVLIPPLATVALILLCIKTLAEGVKLGYRITVLPPRITVGLVYGIMIMVGCYCVYGEATQLRNHARLKKSGVPTSGILQMVTRHSVNFIPTGYTFTINYAGRSKAFGVDSRLLNENTLPDGKFTHHAISLVYLPDEPDVAELPGMLGFHMSSLFAFLMGGILVFLGGHCLRRLIKR